MMEVSEYITIFFVSTISIFIVFGLIFQVSDFKYVIAEHTDYELQYNESLNKISLLNEELDKTYDELKYCEEYKGISHTKYYVQFLIFMIVFAIAIWYFNWFDKRENRGEKR